MFTVRRTLKDLFRVTVLAMLPLFAGCGGGGA
jgi:hypothetical protein